MNEGRKFSIMHEITFGFLIDNDSEYSDFEKTKFGIRLITSELYGVQKNRLFYVNYKPILVRGTAWCPDMYFRHHGYLT